MNSKAVEIIDGGLEVGSKAGLELETDLIGGILSLNWPQKTGLCKTGTVLKSLIRS